MESREAVFRVERGQADAAELAAVAAVLLAVSRNRGPVVSRRRARAGSSWWRSAGGYRSPASWR
ncbi:hypothetical protein B9W68_30415 [Streptomyces sp. CS227]|uniref:acyl-CoA carboxylase epsilon subunit n=1 Tax=Streptomyces sp. CS227 TaxID=1982763 RepID=UPI000B40F193|nr:hypothetical protein B9W68_30415 [Streptomyces sp. CS227]